MRLTDHQTKTLHALKRLNGYDGWCPTAPEVSRDLGYAKYWAAPKLNALAKRGLAERVCDDPSFVTWRITNAGIALIDPRP